MKRKIKAWALIRNRGLTSWFPPDDYTGMRIMAKKKDAEVYKKEQMSDREEKYDVVACEITYKIK